MHAHTARLVEGIELRDEALHVRGTDVLEAREHPHDELEAIDASAVHVEREDILDVEPPEELARALLL